MQRKAPLPGKNGCTNVLDIGSFGSKTWETCERLAKAKGSPFFLKAFSCELVECPTNKFNNYLCVN